MTDEIERNILTLATREQSATGDEALILALASSPNWVRVLQLAEAHGVTAFVAAAVRRVAPAGAVPIAVQRQLRLHAAAAALANAAGVAALTRILNALAAQHIEVLLLKGPALALALYPNPGLRPFSDLDLLCRPQDLSAADAVLRASGFELSVQKTTELEGFHLNYLPLAGAPPVEIHRDLLQLGLPTRCLPALWCASEPITFGATPARMLGLEHQVLHLCVHLHTHGYRRLIWFKDLDLLLRQRGDQVDWPLVHALAAAEGASLSVRHALSFLQELLATPLPTAALAGMRSNLIGEIAHTVLWPHRAVLALDGKQRLRSVRFNPQLGPLGMLPSLLVMGRRSEKLARLVPGRKADAWSLQAITHTTA